MIGLFLVLIPVILGLVWAWYRRPRPATEPQCGKCGYNIRGLPSPICPECGSDLRKVGTHPVSSETQRRYFMLVAFWLILCWIGGSIPLWLLGNLPALTYHSRRSNVIYSGPHSKAFRSVRIDYNLHGYGRPPAKWRGGIKITLTPNSGTAAPLLEVDPATLQFREPVTRAAGTLKNQSLATWLKSSGATGSDEQLLAEATVLLNHIITSTTQSRNVITSASVSGSSSGSSSSSSGFSGPAPWLPFAAFGTLSVLWLLGIYFITRKFGARPRAEP